MHFDITDIFYGTANYYLEREFMLKKNSFANDKKSLKTH